MRTMQTDPYTTETPDRSDVGTQTHTRNTATTHEQLSQLREFGYGINEFTGNPIDNRNAYALRGTILAKPSEDLEITLSGEYFTEDDSNYAFHYFGPTVAPENRPGSIPGRQLTSLPM